jgi:hypothetical protein
MGQRLRKLQRRRAVASKRRREMIRRWGLTGTVALALLTVLVWQSLRPMPGEAAADLGNRHLLPGETFDGYNTVPPTSGPHYQTKATDGIHSEPIPNELQVHNLEDGGVMVQYNCPEGCDELVEQLASIVSRYSWGVILAPYPAMESRVALTAWGRIDRLDAFDEKRITAFIDTYRGIDHHR